MAAPQIWLRSAIEAAAGCEAHPLITPEGLVPPYVIYVRTATARDTLLSDVLDSPATGTETPPTATFTVEVYVDDYVAVWAAADQIAAAIHGFAGEHEGTTIEAAAVVDQSDGEPVFFEGRDTPTYVVEITVEVRWS
jgi:hypothetical protein